jgi:hypothetical protein
MINLSLFTDDFRLFYRSGKIWPSLHIHIGHFATQLGNSLRSNLLFAVDCQLRCIMYVCMYVCMYVQI